MAQTVNAEYSSVLSMFKLNESREEELLDAQNGFAPRMRQLCDDQIADAEDARRDFDLTPEELDALKLERDTWALLQDLYGHPTPTPSPREVLRDNPYTPASRLVHFINKQSRTTEELLIVREWLHSSAPPPPQPESANGYWSFTKQRVLHAKRTGNPKFAESLISELDPDALARAEPGHGLAPEDDAFETALLETLYLHIRAGRVFEAMDACKQAQRPWRAASIRGSILYSASATVSSKHDEDVMDTDSYISSGNKRRKLWKSSCTHAALNPQLSEYERAFYASLAPSSSTLPFILSVCRTWSDHLWARVCVLYEEKLSAELKKIGGGYFEGGYERTRQAIQDPPVEMESDMEDEFIRTLEGMETVSVEDGPGPGDPYHVAQLHIILNRTDLLLEKAAQLFDRIQGPEHPGYDRYIRFFSHLSLYLRHLNLPTPALAVQVILQKYVDLLERTGERDLIAQYAAALGDNSIERYALFLSSLPLDTTVEARFDSLNLAGRYDLPVDLVAKRTAELSVTEALKELPHPLEVVEIDEEADLSLVERFLMRSTEWTISSTVTYPHALLQSNTCIRYFLGVGKPQAAEAILNFLPQDVGSQTSTEEQKAEHIAYRYFIAAWVAYRSVQQVAHSSEARDPDQRYLKDYSAKIEDLKDKTLELLQQDWLQPSYDEDAARDHDLRRIRKMYIPELILRLHRALFDSRKHIPKNHKRVFDLVNIVADQRYNLTLEFSRTGSGQPNKLKAYLAEVEKAVVAGLEKGGSDPFLIVNQ
ncbi:hypothetical protein SISNIDRAFT_484035 [Sistotremastrum niveocremeum HHB9708]|uniref:Nuclear pore complex protein n=1 Tax=Sistotremastrum niveocremeum HHB9708 TaxID=1314777 RepID=A0A164WLV5_9AGAM|nr:hypothetical protein SISNIDRAFT_484035 [Sistotremastrum niveocremeum HHB9708]